MGQESPPKWSLRLLRLIIHGEYLEEIEGDMQEVFFDDLEIYSLKKARRNYSRGVANLFRISLIKNLKWINKIGLIVTIMRTIRLAFRNLLKFKTHSAVNLVGLSLGLAISSLILLYVLDELSFDNFHTKGDRIYKVVTNASNGEMETNAHPVGYQLRTNFPEVEAVVYTRNASSTFKVNHKNERFAHDIYYAGEEFFQIFSFELLAGNAEEVLKAPYSVVITESLEDVYFDGDALGKTLKMRDSIDFKVTGVVEKLPPNSHIQFDILISFSTFPDFRYFSLTDGWGNFDVRNYLLLNEGVEINEFESKISSIYDDNVGEWLSEMGMSMSVALLPLKELYLNDSYWNGFGPNGSEKKVKTVSVIAFFLLVLACINYINLSTARSAYRAKEVGMKKVVGSSKQGIVGQFMMESFLLTIISFAFALILIIGSLPFFNDLMLKEYTAISLLSKEYIAGISMLLLVVAFLSGYYPALIISELKPLQALSGKLSKTYKGLNLRKGLIAFQFFISSGLVLATLLVVDQIEYMRTHGSNPCDQCHEHAKW
ncbi:MAG: ABC transporter permease [Ekhidna sp.]|nr:ABC transporter permease [Ekhidna sp.]